MTASWLTRRLPAGDALWLKAGQMPGFYIDFTRRTIVDQIGGIVPTFTRASSVKLAWDGSQFVSYAADTPAFQLDPTTGRWGYLHEPAATNLFLNSGSPATQNVTVTAQAYTLSFFGTGTITLSGASTAGPLVGTGAEPNRVRLTFTPSAGTLTLTVSGTITRPQLETGSIATSPITTAGASVTRAADTLQIGGADFSKFYNQAGGALYVEYAPLGTVQPGGARIVEFATASGTETVRYRYSGGTTPVFDVLNSSVTQASFSYSVLSNLSTRRFAGAWATNNFSASENGSIPLVDTSGTLGTVDRLHIGHVNTAAISATTFYSVAYFPPGPAANNIQRMTA